MCPFEMTVSASNTHEGYAVTVTLESKDRSNPVTVSRKKVYVDLSDISDIRQEAIDEYNLKAGEFE